MADLFEIKITGFEITQSGDGHFSHQICIFEKDQQFSKTQIDQIIEFIKRNYEVDDDGVNLAVEFDDIFETGGESMIFYSKQEKTNYIHIQLVIAPYVIPKPKIYKLSELTDNKLEEIFAEDSNVENNSNVESDSDVENDSDT